MLPAASDGVTGYASSAGFDGVFTGGKPCRAEKNFNPGADLRSVVRKLIRSIVVVTPARRDVDITLGALNMKLRRTFGYSALFGFVAPPIGGFWTWAILFVPYGLASSVQRGWDAAAWSSVLKILPTYMIFSYAIGFFAAAIFGAIYGIKILELKPIFQYMASFGTAMIVQGVFLAVFGGMASGDPFLTASITVASGLTALCISGALNASRFLRKTPNLSFQRTASSDR